MNLLKRITGTTAAAIVALSAWVGSAQQSEATPVDLELALLVDVSGSIDSNEFALQRNGYANAFNSAAIQNAILSTTGGRLGKIAATYIQWSGASQQAISVDWTLIDSAASATAFANSIATANRAFDGLTAPGSAINFVTPMFGSNAFVGANKVIDVSGDGDENDGDNTAAARDAALAAGIDRINGLAIGNQSLVNWYASNIVGGTNAFVLQATSFRDFQDAINKKLTSEITGTTPIPLPAPALLLLAGLFGLGAVSRRKAGA